MFLWLTLLAISILVKKIKFSLITPLNLRYWWNLGRLLGIRFIIQIIRGIILRFYYENSIFRFFRVWKIHLEIFNGYIIHYIHINFSRFIFFIIFIHIFKALLFGSFLKIKILWLRGMLIIIITIIISFLGYVLPIGQIRLWGATVITNLLSIFFYGDSLVKWIWGGYFVSFNTIKVFFSLHFILPMLLVVLILIHLVLLHYRGSSNPLGSDSSLIKIEFITVYFFKDIINLIIILIFIIYMLINPYFCRDSENFILANSLISPLHIQPEWYFLQYYAILRAIPNKLGGIIIFIISLIILVIIIFYKNYFSLRSFKLWKRFSYFFININLLLIWLGRCPVEYPYLILSQILRIIYFLWFIFVWLYLNFFY